MTSATNNIRVQNYPALEEGNSSFPNAGYNIKHMKGKEKTGMILEHYITGAPIISEMLEQGNAEYACAISSPKAGYRELFVSSDFRQYLQWDIRKCGDPPCFTPMIVVKKSTTDLELCAEKHGVHELWSRAKVKFPRGARLAVHPPFRLTAPNLGGMVMFFPDETMEEGVLQAEAYTPSDFIFRIYCHPDFHRRVQRAATGNRRASGNLDPLVATACFQILKHKYADDNGDEGWQSYSNLEQLAKYLDDNGCLHWSHEDFNSFKTATFLHPFLWPTESNEDA